MAPQMLDCNQFRIVIDDTQDPPQVYIEAKTTVPTVGVGEMEQVVDFFLQHLVNEQAKQTN